MSNTVQLGTNALKSLSTGDSNVAIGTNAGKSVTTGNSNVIVGANGGKNITTGSSNFLIGDSVGSGITSESDNIIVNNASTNATSGDILLGNSQAKSGNYQLMIGNDGADENMKLGVWRFAADDATPTVAEMTEVSNDSDVSTSTTQFDVATTAIYFVSVTHSVPVASESSALTITNSTFSTIPFNPTNGVKIASAQNNNSRRPAYSAMMAVRTDASDHITCTLTGTAVGNSTSTSEHTNARITQLLNDNNIYTNTSDAYRYIDTSGIDSFLYLIKYIFSVPWDTADSVGTDLTLSSDKRTFTVNTDGLYSITSLTSTGGTWGLPGYAIHWIEKNSDSTRLIKSTGENYQSGSTDEATPILTALLKLTAGDTFSIKTQELDRLGYTNLSDSKLSITKLRDNLNTFFEDNYSLTINQPVATGTDTLIVLDTSDSVESDINYINGIFTCKSRGTYVFNLNVVINDLTVSATAHEAELWMIKNTEAPKLGRKCWSLINDTNWISGNAVKPMVNICYSEKLEKDDTIKLYLWQNTGSQVNILGSGTRTQEVISITTDVKASIVASSMIMFYTDQVSHYFWFDTTGSDFEPVPDLASDAPVNTSSHRVNISGDTTANDVAATLASVINAVTGFTTSGTTSPFTVTWDTPGAVKTAEEYQSSVSNSTGLTIAVTQQGTAGLPEITTLDTTGTFNNISTGAGSTIPNVRNDALFWLFTTSTSHYFWYNIDSTGADPSPSAPSGAPATTSGHAIAITQGSFGDGSLALTIKNAIDALGDFGATVSTNVVTVTHAANADVRDAEDGVAAAAPSATFAISQTTAGTGEFAYTNLIVTKIDDYNPPVIEGDMTNRALTLANATNISTSDLQTKSTYVNLNHGNTSTSAIQNGIAVNYQATSTADIVAGAFTAGVAASSNPTVITSGSATFTAGDIIEFAGTNKIQNNGIFEVASHSGTTLTVRGIGTTATVEAFSKQQFVTDTVSGGIITKVNVAILQTDSSGDWQVGKGATTGITYTPVSFAPLVDHYRLEPSQNVLTSTITIVNYAALSVETDISLSSGTFTINTTGIYSFTGDVTFFSNGNNGEYQAYIGVNGSTYYSHNSITTNPGNASFPVAWTGRLTATDTIAVYAWQNTGITIGLRDSSVAFACNIHVTRFW